MTEIETFEDYLREARDEFVMEINSNEWNTKVRTAAEDFLICFDQLRERFLAANTVAVDNIADSEEKIIQKLKERLEWGNNLYEKGYGYINPEHFGLEKAIEIISSKEQTKEVSNKPS